MIHLKRLYTNNFKQLQEVDLHFPERGRILVQGKNEAGKSTLFEAVFFALFGTALATETGARGLDDLIGYGMEKARVELDVASGDRVFKTARTDDLELMALAREASATILKQDPELHAHPLMRYEVMKLRASSHQE